MPYLGRRILETLICSLATSMPLFLVIGLISGAPFAEVLMCLASVLAFTVLNILALRRHIIAIGSIRRYLAVNCSIWLLWTAVAFVSLYLFNETFYKWLFMPARLFEMFHCAATTAMIAYSALFLVVILISPAELYGYIPWSRSIAEKYGHKGNNLP